MTKKDFQKIASVIKDTSMPCAIRAHLAWNFAQVCKADNPRFDIQRFIDACGQIKVEGPVTPESESRFIRATRVFDDTLDRDLAKHL
jgi:hypothetical protein